MNKIVQINFALMAKLKERFYVEVLNQPSLISNGYKCQFGYERPRIKLPGDYLRWSSE